MSFIPKDNTITITKWQPLPSHFFVSRSLLLTAVLFRAHSTKPQRGGIPQGGPAGIGSKTSLDVAETFGLIFKTASGWRIAPVYFRILQLFSGYFRILVSGYFGILRGV
jgi:hypothetical protein